jgi:hypothetical protein
MPLEKQSAPSWWGCLCTVCFASKKPSKREFFAPAGMDLAVKLFNHQRKRQEYPLAPPEDIFQSVGGFVYATSIEFNMGYLHMNLAQSAHKSSQL